MSNKKPGGRDRRAPNFASSAYPQMVVANYPSNTEDIVEVEFYYPGEVDPIPFANIMRKGLPNVVAVSASGDVKQCTGFGVSDTPPFVLEFPAGTFTVLRWISWMPYDPNLRMITGEWVAPGRQVALEV